MLQKPKSSFWWSKKAGWICLCCLAVIGSGLICCRVPERPALIEVPEDERAADSNAINAACELIYQGEFDAAGELINSYLAARDSSLKSRGTRHGGLVTRCAEEFGQLARIVAGYSDISQRRQTAGETAYREQLAKLEEFRAAADANDVNDVNDVNDIPKVLSVIARISGFSDDRRRQELLGDEFVKQTLQKAMDKASEFEAEGKWLDAYISCYSWLQAIDEDNKAYSDYTEQLLEKANIVASFQDSPCESREERYEGIKKEIFVRVVNALQFNYVTTVDYRQMALEAIKRCELLAEVMSLSSVVRNAYGAKEDTQWAAWLAALAAITDDVSQSAGFSKNKFIGIFEKVLELNRSVGYGARDPNGQPESLLPLKVLIAQFTEAALSALDPYTVLVWPKNVPEFEKLMTNEFTGIGIEISKQKGLLTVASLLPDTPAYNSGLDAGDVIEEVDDVPTKDMSLSCAIKNITGPAGTEVTLTIRRAGEQESRDITIIRARIIVSPLRGWQRTEAGEWLYMIDDTNKIGYIRITGFDWRTANELERVLTELESEGLNGLILDLRFNSGGLLNIAIEVTDKFIEEGPIVSTRPRFWVSSTYASAKKENTHPNYPLVVLVNRFSASASEIVAGALADEVHKRAVLVGERTHGKGSVQGIISYRREGAQLKYTMAYYHLPSGQRVESQDAVKKLGRDDWGVGPNIEVKLRSDELKKMFDVRRDNDVLVKADHDNGLTPLKRHTAEETLAADPQLAVATLVIRAKLIQAGIEMRAKQAIQGRVPGQDTR